MKLLTAKQAAILGFMKAYQSEFQVLPSTRDIQQEFGFASQNAVMDHIRAIERKGYIQRLPGKARSAVLVDGNTPAASAPMYKREDATPDNQVTASRWKGYLSGVGLAAVSAWVVTGNTACGIHAAGHEVSLCLLSGQVKENGQPLGNLSHTGLLTFMGIVLSRLA